jgi:hypothetical protein
MSESDGTPAGTDPAQTGSGPRGRKGRTQDPAAAGTAPEPGTAAAGPAAAAGSQPAPGTVGSLVMEAERHLANYQIANPAAAPDLNPVRNLLQRAARLAAQASEGDGGYATGGTSG